MWGFGDKIAIPLTGKVKVSPVTNEIHLASHTFAMAGYGRKSEATMTKAIITIRN